MVRKILTKCKRYFVDISGSHLDAREEWIAPYFES